MPKIFPDDQRNMVRAFKEKGMTNVEIAEEMAKMFPAEWSSKTAFRSVARILDEEPKEVQPSKNSKTLDEMTREERFKYIESRMQTTPRFRIAMRSFDKDDRELFVDEYLTVIKSTETLTEVEEQSLFAAILDLILAFQALNRKEAEEKWRDLSLDGTIPPNDPRYRLSVNDKYQKEYDQHMKLYQKGMEGLKMSRSQRLKEVRSQKQTLVDLAEELSTKNAQGEAADEIERLSRLKDSELKKLLEQGHLHGIFEDFA